jgi:3-hydroxybutyryl-CoA dehydrogenase
VSEAAAGFPGEAPVAHPHLKVRRVALIGAGVAGRKFALECAAAGFEVVLEDVMPEKLRRAQDAYAEMLAGPGVGSLRVALTVEDAVRDADIAIDFVPDELESKLEIFCLLDRMAPPKTILLTPSDALSITDLASCTYRGGQCFAVRGGLVDGGETRVLHPASASEAALADVSGFLTAMGRIVRVEPDADTPMLVKNLRVGVA